MSDEELAALWREARDDLGGAVRYVLALLRRADRPDPATALREVRTAEDPAAPILRLHALVLRSFSERIESELRSMHTRLTGEDVARALRELADRIDEDANGLRVAVDVPPTAEQLSARPVLGARDVFHSGRRLGLDPGDRRDTLARWLVVHAGKVINLCQDPPGFEAIEAPEELKRLRKWVDEFHARMIG